MCLFIQRMSTSDFNCRYSVLFLLNNENKKKSNEKVFLCISSAEKDKSKSRVDNAVFLHRGSCRQRKKNLEEKSTALPSG